MPCDINDLEAYVRLTAPDATDEALSTQLATLRASIDRGDADLAEFCVSKTPTGDLRAALRLVPIGGSTFVLAGPFMEAADADGAAAGLVTEAMQRAHALKARLIRSRPRSEALGPHYRAALRAQGFDDLGERVEFKTPVSELPLDDGTPLRWRDLTSVGEELAAAVLQTSAVGDPHSEDAQGDAHAALTEWLSAPGLTTAPTCVQVGYLDDSPVAFVCAQVSPKDGWSRITYMGVLPQERGRGLGTWVHRRGFRMLQEQGGALYHGGTSAANEGMLHLFHKHGCKEVERMLELEWHAPDANARV